MCFGAAGIEALCRHDVHFAFRGLCDNEIALIIGLCLRIRPSLERRDQCAGNRGAGWVHHAAADLARKRGDHDIGDAHVSVFGGNSSAGEIGIAGFAGPLKLHRVLGRNLVKRKSTFGVCGQPLPEDRPAHAIISHRACDLEIDLHAAHRLAGWSNGAPDQGVVVNCFCDHLYRRQVRQIEALRLNDLPIITDMSRPAVIVALPATRL